MIHLRNIFKSITLPVVVLLLITGSCREENVQPTTGKVTITFSAAKTPSGGRIQDTRKPEFVFVSVVDQHGNAKQFIRLQLVAFGSGYISEDLELATGHYRLTDFFVMDTDGELLYATPKEGSPLAKFVNDPLDISFDVHTDDNTEVRPQVLGVEEAAKPDDFGYASFAFDVVDITALILPETSETIVKVSYKFNNLFASAEGAVIPDGDLVDLADARLLNNTWNATITVWTEPKECITQWSNSPYQKVYRLKTELTFTGAAFQLPDFSSKRWDPYYYRTSHGLEFFFSANPLKSYSVEVHVPDSINANYCWLDRRYWNASGNETCDLGGDAYAHLDMTGQSEGKFRMENQPACETPALQIVDSFVAVNSDHGAFHEFFSWTIVNGEAVPSCDVDDFAAKKSSLTERPAPSTN